MKQISFIVALFISTLAFGQQEPEIIAELKGTERIGNFITRWYYDKIDQTVILLRLNNFIKRSFIHHFAPMYPGIFARLVGKKDRWR